MNRIVKLALAVYVLVMFVCTISFFMQKSVIYGDHINPAREDMMEFRGTNPDTAQAIEYNRSLAESSIRMGNELQEHLFILLLANLATGVFLVLCVLHSMKDNQRLKADGLNAAA